MNANRNVRRECLKALTKISEARFIHQKDEKYLYKSMCLGGNTVLLSYSPFIIARQKCQSHPYQRTKSAMMPYAL